MHKQLVESVHELLDSYVVMSEMENNNYTLLKVDSIVNNERHIFWLYSKDRRGYHSNGTVISVLVKEESINAFIKEYDLYQGPIELHHLLQGFKYERSQKSQNIIFDLKDVEELKKLMEALDEYGYILNRKTY